MQLDRNKNKDGGGKYALVNMRKLRPIIDAAFEQEGVPHETVDIYNAFHLLLRKGIISLGNETPGDQFFVMKYKDRFTADGLRAYADAAWDFAGGLRVRGEATQASDSLAEYAAQLRDEADKARDLGRRIPD